MLGFPFIGSPNSIPTTLSRKIFLLVRTRTWCQHAARPAVYLYYFREARLLARLVLLYYSI
ncbi:hypothetical protein PISMIDRAFT_680391, partial [Pisolithus microcarpus 441]